MILSVCMQSLFLRSFVHQTTAPSSSRRSRTSWSRRGRSAGRRCTAAGCRGSASAGRRGGASAWRGRSSAPRCRGRTAPLRCWCRGSAGLVRWSFSARLVGGKGIPAWARRHHGSGPKGLCRAHRCTGSCRKFFPCVGVVHPFFRCRGGFWNQVSDCFTRRSAGIRWKFPVLIVKGRPHIGGVFAQ